MKAHWPVFATEGSALDGFDESPSRRDAGRTSLRVWLLLLLLLALVGVSFLWHVPTSPGCGAPASLRVVPMPNGGGSCVVRDMPVPVRGGLPKTVQCFARDADAQGMVRDAQARSLDCRSGTRAGGSS